MPQAKKTLMKRPAGKAMKKPSHKDSPSQCAMFIVWCRQGACRPVHLNLLAARTTRSCMVAPSAVALSLGAANAESGRRMASMAISLGPTTVSSAAWSLRVKISNKRLRLRAYDTTPSAQEEKQSIGHGTTVAY